jgi:hypothetical protein
MTALAMTTRTLPPDPTAFAEWVRRYHAVVGAVAFGAAEERAR